MPYLLHKVMTYVDWLIRECPDLMDPALHLPPQTTSRYTRSSWVATKRRNEIRFGDIVIGAVRDKECFAEFFCCREG